MNLLQASNLQKSFDAAAAPVLHDVSLSVEKGEILALIGPSGCGKSTTLRLISGLDQPDAGRVCVAGRDVTGLPPQKRGIGMVFQDYALFPHMTVAQNILFGAGRDDPALLARLLGLIGLEDMGGRYPDELSGGQQQRVALARSLAARLDVILLDEPFSNLDPQLRTATRREFRKMLKASGLGVVVVTHDQEEALSFADRVAVMHQGRILQTGTAQQIYCSPCNAFVAGFIGRTNLIDGVAAGAVCETALGMVPLAGQAQGKVRLSLRPESMMLRQCDIAGASARITMAEFKGHDTTYWVDWQGNELQVDMMGGPDLPVGTPVTVEILRPATILGA